MRLGPLRLDRPHLSDVDAIFEIYRDPRLWAHLPSGRHTDPLTTEAMVQRWISGWTEYGLGPWIVREAETDVVLGHAGCDLRFDTFWNLGFRFAYRAHGHGYASRTSRHAVEAAKLMRPETPVVAYLLEHNHASARVTQKTGLSLRHRAIDRGNPDPSAVRMIYADRELAHYELAATLR